MKTVCQQCGDEDVTPGVGPNGVGCIGSRSDMPDVAFCKCTRCYEDDKTRASHPRRHRPTTIFDTWVDMNKIICPGRARFDAIREEMCAATSIEEVRLALVGSGFATRYPLLPEKMPEVSWVPA